MEKRELEKGILGWVRLALWEDMGEWNILCSVPSDGGRQGSATLLGGVIGDKNISGLVKGRLQMIEAKLRQG